MAIQINGTDVIDNSKNIVNINDAKMTGTVLSKQTAFAYALVDGDSNFADNYNFASCTQTSTGRLTFVFDTPPAGGPNNARNYVVLVQPDSVSPFDVSRVANRLQNSFEVYTFNGSTPRDRNVFVLVFSDSPR